jgi:translation initiation factor IF-1
MSFEEDDQVILHDEHSEFDGEEGTITQVVETMFGDANYTVSFEDGQEAGIAEDRLELVEESDEEDDEEIETDGGTETESADEDGDGFTEDDEVILHDEHSEFDGEEGTITQVVETMFGDANYTVSFEDGEEAGIAEDRLEPAE